jgi:hypothetical protein
MDEKKFKDELVLLLSYLITSARGCMDEPKSYGPFRLIDSASRLIALMRKYGISDEALDSIAKEIDQDKFSTMTDSKRFLRMLDDVVLKSLDVVNTVIS